ncbi:MAG: carbohydrate binding family 9 domain-containing protein [Candidatus Marinimicrobia bacterium]|nr:carbohydrate binding family 9 domain-containing protein [Candidatus Neomarinimicrobiota bacterium]
MNSFVFLFLIGMLFANQSKKTLLVRETHQIPEIDGQIESCWAKADSTTSFVQHQPYHNHQPSRKTVARILTTKNDLYCLIMCYGNPQQLANYTGKLDDLNNADYVALILDSFGNNRTAYKFSVSASGVRSDCRLLDDGRNNDYSWNGIWYANAKTYDWGYAVELRIPYKSIQYKKGIDWGLDFYRYIPNKNEDIYWNKYDRNEGQRISKAGQLVFNNFQLPKRKMHMEIYPVGLTQVEYQDDGNYKFSPDLGLDVLYNPSPQLTFQFTANPDFAQIEADPYEFNISRYETYYDERRPFFTEGNEIFMAAGKQTGTGFYNPMELFYSRRIGRKLPDGSEVPLLAGVKSFGRIDKYEYGGFFAYTGEKEYTDDDTTMTEERASFSSLRLKRQIFGNSSLGLLYVGKKSPDGNNGVMDIDGAVRGSNWQLAYQLARSYKNDQGGYAGSAGLTSFGDNFMFFAKSRIVGNNFDVSEVGYVPWQGTSEFVVIGGPMWHFENGELRRIMLFGGPWTYYEKEDKYTDRGGILGFNMHFRSGWGYEINFQAGSSKDLDKKYNSYSCYLSSWFNVSPRWDGNLWASYEKTYNFKRNYLAFYNSIGIDFNWNISRTMEIGSSFNTYIEGNPDGNIEEITYNSRPFISSTPINNMNIRIYLDNLFLKSSGEFERLIGGFLFSYNFSPKSWLYIALNEVQQRPGQRLKVQDRAGAIKLKYLYHL